MDLFVFESAYRGCLQLPFSDEDGHCTSTAHLFQRKTAGDFQEEAEKPPMRCFIFRWYDTIIGRTPG